MTGIDRRAFVKVGASGALLIGLPAARGEGLQKQLAAAAPARAPLPIVPTNWAQFRDELKKRNQPGVIVLLQPLPQVAVPGKGDPKEDAKLREVKQQFGVPQAECSNDLATCVNTTLFNCGNSELPLLLVQAVFIAAPAQDVRKEFPSLPTNAGLALIGPDGKVLSSLPVDADMGKKFGERAGELLHGKNGALLAERVKAERAALGQAEAKKFDEALVDLDHDDFSRRQQASQVLLALFARTPGSLMQAFRDAPSLEVRSRIDALFRKKLHDENTAALLQRSLAPHVAAANFDVRVLCGQGALRPQAHEFVQRWCEATDV